jgi:iron complex outermembrane recepter protein
VPHGTQLPIVPKFKGNATVRYSFTLGTRDMQGYAQGAYSYTSSSNSTLAPYQNNLLGSVPAYGLLDLMFGINKGNFTAELFASNALDKRAQTYRFAECTIVEGVQTFIPAGRDSHATERSALQDAPRFFCPQSGRCAAAGR